MSERIQRFEDLIAWQKARALTRMVYGVSGKRPFFGDFALRDQIREAALSVMSNIAEGFERDRITEFLYFLRVAKASCGEVRSQVYVAADNGYIDEKVISSMLACTAEVSRLIRGLHSALSKRQLGTRHSALGTS